MRAQLPRSVAQAAARSLTTVASLPRGCADRPARPGLPGLPARPPGRGAARRPTGGPPTPGTPPPSRPPRAPSCDPEQAERGLGFLRGLLHDLEAGKSLDQMSRDLLVAAFSRHPDFRPEWNRWRRGERRSPGRSRTCVASPDSKSGGPCRQTNRGLSGSGYRDRAAGSPCVEVALPPRTPHNLCGEAERVPRMGICPGGGGAPQAPRRARGSSAKSFSLKSTARRALAIEETIALPRRPARSKTPPCPPRSRRRRPGRSAARPTSSADGRARQGQGDVGVDVVTPSLPQLVTMLVASATEATATNGEDRLVVQHGYAGLPGRLAPAVLVVAERRGPSPRPRSRRAAPGVVAHRREVEGRRPRRPVRLHTSPGAGSPALRNSVLARATATSPLLERHGVDQAEPRRSRARPRGRHPAGLHVGGPEEVDGVARRAQVVPPVRHRPLGARASSAHGDAVHVVGAPQALRQLQRRSTRPVGVAGVAGEEGERHAGILATAKIRRNGSSTRPSPRGRPAQPPPTPSRSRPQVVRKRLQDRSRRCRDPGEDRVRPVSTWRYVVSQTSTRQPRAARAS